MPLQRAVRCLVLGVLIGLLFACGSGGGDVQPPPPPPSGSYTLTITQGDKQNVFAGAFAPVPIFVRLGTTGTAPSGVNVPLTLQVPQNVKAFPQITGSGPGWLTEFWLRAPDTPFTTEQIQIGAPGGVSANVTISSGPRLKKTFGNASTVDPVILPDGRVIAFGEPQLYRGNVESNMAAFRADGTVEKLFAPGDLMFPIGSKLLSARFVNGEIITGGHNSDYWFLDQSLNVKRYINECKGVAPGAHPDYFPASDSEGNLYFIGEDFDPILSRRISTVKRMTPHCEITTGGTLQVQSFLGLRDMLRTPTGTFVAMTDEEKDDFDSSNDFDTSTISEFDFSGAIIRQKKLPLLERWPGGGPAYKLGGQRPDGSYVLAKDQSMGLLILNSNFDVVGEVQLHSFDGSPVRVGSLRGVDAAGNSYFGDSGYDTTPEARRFLKFNPEGELLWWSGSPLFPAAPDLQPVAPYPLPYDYYHATVDPNGTAVYLAGGGLTKLGVDGNVTTNGMTYTAGPEFGPDGYLYTAEFQQFPNLVVVRAWTTSMQPVFSFSLPEISRSAFAIAFSSTGDLYLRTESDVHRVDSSHNYLGMFAAPTRKFHPELAVMSDGNLLITTQDPEGKSYLRKLTSAGTVIWSKDDPGAAGLAVDAAGRIWLHTGQGVQVWDQDGNPLGGGTIIQAESSAGDGLPIAAHGNDVWFYCGGRVYIASAE